MSADSTRNYKDEVRDAQAEANADPRIVSAVIQAKAIDRLTHEVARVAKAFEEYTVIKTGHEHK